jgi:hypothetical protein
MSVRPGKKTLKYCVVIFSDGREKEFNSVPTSPLNGGVYYKIEYNGSVRSCVCDQNRKEGAKMRSLIVEV